MNEYPAILDLFRSYHSRDLAYSMSNECWDFDASMGNHHQILHDHMIDYYCSMEFFPEQLQLPPTTTPAGIHGGGDREGEEKEEEEEEVEEEKLGEMKEMMYKIAAMQPVDIDPSTIQKPKRRNVRISHDPQSVAARHRRERISERIRILRRLVPGGTRMDTASMLDEAIRYVKFLKREVRELESRPQPSATSSPPLQPSLIGTQLEEGTGDVDWLTRRPVDRVVFSSSSFVEASHGLGFCFSDDQLIL